MSKRKEFSFAEAEVVSTEALSEPELAEPEAARGNITEFRLLEVEREARARLRECRGGPDLNLRILLQMTREIRRWRSALPKCAACGGSGRYEMWSSDRMQRVVDDCKPCAGTGRNFAAIRDRAVVAERQRDSAEAMLSYVARHSCMPDSIRAELDAALADRATRKDPDHGE